MDRVLVYGPPGAGKSTVAAGMDGYTHLEREQFGSDRAFRNAVHLNRDELLVVVRCCFSPGELDEWRRRARATRVVLVDPGLSEVKRRLYGRGHPKWRGELLGALRWYAGWDGFEDEPVIGRKASRW